MKALVLLIAAFVLALSCGRNQADQLAAYLTGAEIQAETDEQRATLRLAFDDMLTKRPDQLRAARYGSKPLPAFIRAHVVPTRPVPVEDEEFYRGASTAAVRAAILTLRDKLPKE